MITVKHKIQSWNLPTLVSWDRASYLVDSPFPPPRALAFRVDTQEIHYENGHDTIPEEYDVPGLASLDPHPPPVEAGQYQYLYQRLLLALSFQRQENSFCTYKNAT